MNSPHYNLLIIGGGPAGMMAAGRAAELGAKVLLLEKNPSLGKKLLITGGGRCNVTNAELDVRRFLSKFKSNQKFLFSPFSRFGVADTLDFFNEHGMPTKIEAENRAFPVSDSAKSVWDVLLAYMKRGKVTIKTNSPVRGFEHDGERITGVRLKDKTLLRADAYVLATGGKSHPETGSTGEGFNWLKDLGHTVIDLEAALVPVKTKESWTHALAGLSFKDVKLSVLQNAKKQASLVGKLLFTHFGLSGPLALNLSRDIGELLKYGPLTLSLDLMPGRDIKEIDAEIISKLRAAQNRQIQNSLKGLQQTALINAFIKKAGIALEKPANLVTRDERLKIARLFKNIELTPTGLLGMEKAIIASGGVKLEEVDFKTMRSKKYPNLYLVGDILNIDRPSGGYSLQLCWTTGYVAGTNAAESK